MKLWLNRFVVGCLYGILLVPLVFQQALMHPLVIVKTLYFQILIEVACAGYIVLALFYKEYRPRITPLFIAVCGLLSVIFIAGAFGVNSARSIWSVPDRMTGMILMAHLTAYFIILSGMRQSFSWRRYMQVSLGVSFLVAVFPIIQLIFPGIFFDRLGDRLSGTIGNPIFLAAYLFFHVFIAGYYGAEAYVQKKRWWPYAVVGLFNVVVILLTQTRGALIALAASLIVLSVRPILGRNGMQVQRILLGLWAFCVLFLGVFWATRTHSLWRNVPVLSRIAVDGFSANNRLYAWRAGLYSWTDNPVLGVGWDNFYAAFNAHYDPRLLRGGFRETFFDRPHNVFVQFLAETGIVGCIVYIALLVCVFRIARRNIWLVAMFVAYYTQNFFAFDSMSSYMMFFLTLAWINSMDGNKEYTHSLHARGGNASQEMLALIASLMVATSGIYFLNYRLYRASNLEWKAINYFVHGEIPEGFEYMDKALKASTPYHVHIAKDVYPNVASLYKQNIPLSNVRAVIEDAVRGMTAAAEADPSNYGFWIGLADMMPLIAELDPRYVDQGFMALAQADRISPRRQATEYVRAKLLNLKGDKAGAITAMERAIALDPEVGDAHFYHALLLLESNDGAGGIRALERASVLGREPRTVSEASVTAAQLGDLGMYKESALFFQKALLMKPDDLELTIKLGLVYYFSGDKAAARRNIAKVMEKQDLRQSPQYGSLRPILIDLGLEK